MADRSFIIEVLLKARDDTARAFASAMGNMEAYDALMDKQKARSEGQIRVNERLTKSEKDVHEAKMGVAQGNEEILKSQARYEVAAQKAARAEKQYQEGNIASAVAQLKARKALGAAQLDLRAKINKAEKESQEKNKAFDRQTAIREANKFKTATRQVAVQKEQLRLLDQLSQKTKQLGNATDRSSIGKIESDIKSIGQSMRQLGADSIDVKKYLDEAFDVGRQEAFRQAQIRTNSAVSEYKGLVDSVAKSERRRDEVLKSGKFQNVQEYAAVKERLDLDVGLARAHLEEFRKTEEAKAVKLHLQVPDHDIAQARLAIDAIDDTRSSGKNLGVLGNVKKQFDDLDTSTAGFANKLRNVFAFAAVGFLQPLLTLIVGLAGAFGALASAAVSAGTALYGVFISAAAQGIPVLGLLGAAMQRLGAIVGYVAAQHQQLEQRFIAGFVTAQQNAMGINQVVIAEHGYSDALYAVAQAQINVRLSEFQLLQTRQQATRQLQDLILQEESAKLAAEASSLAVGNAQKALQAAIASGGDVVGAQLQLRQAQLGHVQATTQAQRAITDASKGSLTRQSIDQQVQQAQRAVTQARRSVVDAQFAAAQARASIIQAQQAAAGYNVGIAAQLAWLRSQMTSTEKALAKNITTIYGMFTGVHGRLRPFTDAILGAFIPLTGRIIKIFNDPKLMRALLGLSRSIGGAITTFSRSFLGNKAIAGFIKLINDAAKNVGPVAKIAASFFKAMGEVAIAIAPSLHSFLGFLGDLIGKFATWAASARGQNWLKGWFDTAFKSLEAFIKLGVSFAQMIAAIIGTGGGAKSGIGLLDDIRKHFDGITNSINSHGKVFKDLQLLWATAKPAIAALREVLDALARSFLAITSDGSKPLKGMADLISNIIIPAFTQFVIIIGQTVGAITGFLSKHPMLQSILKEIIAIALTTSFVVKGIGLIFGPIAALIGLFQKVIVIGRALMAIFDAIKAFFFFRATGLGFMDSLKAANAVAAERLASERGIVAAMEAQTAALTEQMGLQSKLVATETTRVAEEAAITTEEEAQVATRGAGGLTGAAPMGLAALPSALGTLGLIGGGAALAGLLGTTLFHKDRKFDPNQYLQSGGKNIGLPSDFNFLRGKFQPGMTSKVAGQFLSGVTGLDPTQVSVSKLADLRKEAEKIIKLPSITGKQKDALDAFVASVDPARVALQKLNKAWTTAFDGISSTTGDVFQQVSETVANNISNIATNLGTGTQQGAQAFAATIGAAVQTVMNNTTGAARTTGKAVQAINKILNKALKALNLDGVNLGTGITGLEHVQEVASISGQTGIQPIAIARGLPRGVYAGGGFVGSMGERGRDAVHALLGRGEAVLNWGHQKFVEPALKAMYGFGLHGLFNRTGGEHAGGGDGYATGGYVYPFPPGTSVGRVDEGVDANMPVGAPIGPIGRARVGPTIPNWYAGQPLLKWMLLDGPRKGWWVYVSEQIKNLARQGTILAANQAVARYAGSGTGIEYGWSSPSGDTLAHATTGYTEGQQTPAGKNMLSFLSGLAHGKLVGGSLGGAGSTQTAPWKNIHDPVVKGKGAMADMVRSAVRKITHAANVYGRKHAGSSGGVSGDFRMSSGPHLGRIRGGWGYDPGAAHGTITRAQAVGYINGALNALHIRRDKNLWIRTVLRQIDRESSFRINPPPLPAGQDINTARGDPSLGLLQIIKENWQQYALPPYNKNWLDPQSNILAAMRYMIGTYGHGNAHTAVERMWARGGGAYAGGGFVGKAIPILAHAGEWVVNQGQQHKIASRLGTSVGKLKSSLGFTGGGLQSFKGGGVVKESGITFGSSVNTQDTDATLGNISQTGTYTAPTVSIDTPGFNAAAIAQYNRAQAIVAKTIKGSASKISDGIKTFLTNYNNVGGDNGLFALAAQAISDFSSQQQNVVALAAAGVKVVGQKLVHGTAQTAIQAAKTDLNSTIRIMDQLENLQKEQVTALNQVNKEIQKLGPDPTKKSTVAQYQQLIGARQDLLSKIRDTDGNIAQSLSDQFQKTSDLFTAQITANLRGKGYVDPSIVAAIGNGTANLGKALRKFGPTIRLGLAQMSQQLGQSLGDPKIIKSADAAVLDALKDQQSSLQTAYADAVKKAKKDPRWQSVADDLLSQLQDTTSQVAQAQIQQLTDAISAVDVGAQRQQSALGLRSRLATVRAGFGDALGAAQAQIGISRDTATNLTGQRTQYQGLLYQAAAQGNVQAVTELTTKIDDLTGQIAEANLQTQQLITAYHQLSINILQATSQATSGFFGAAVQISQTLGAIAGNQNLPALIAYAKEAGASLIQQGKAAVAAIQQTMFDPNSPFGAAQGQANSLLSQLLAGFQSGPQGFANTLAALSPQLASFESGLPADQQTLFQNLVQSLIDNTTAVVDNTQNLQQLNATTGQQQFTSSAWTLFRDAIFNGMGQLLPKYAQMIPSMDVGGTITRQGLLMGHRGEVMVPAKVNRDVPIGAQENHFHIDHPVEVADPVLFGNAVAWRLQNDPNSR